MNRAAMVWTAVIAAMFFVLGITACVTGTEQTKELSNITADFNEMYAEDFCADKYVKGEIYELWDEFAYEEQYTETFGIKSGSSISSHYYIMPLQTSYEGEEPVFIAVCLRKQDQIEAAERMMDGMNDFWEGTTDDYPEETIYFTGKVLEMDGELLDYFYEWLMYGDEKASRSEYSKYVCPYILTYIAPDNGALGVKIGLVMCGCGLVFLAVTVVVYLKTRNKPSAVYVNNGYVPFPEQTEKTDGEDRHLGAGIDDEK